VRTIILLRGPEVKVFNTCFAHVLFLPNA
jgi:hypothetical protein